MMEANPNQTHGRRLDPRLEDLEVRATWAKIGVIVCVIANTITSLLMVVTELMVPESGIESTLDLMLGLSLVVGGLATLLITIVVAILWGRWTSRMYGNISEIFGEHTERTATLAAWSYVIPFVGYYMPYKIVSEARDKLGADDEGDVTLWWFFWILHLILGQIDWRLGELFEGMTSVFFHAMSASVYVCAGIFAVKVLDLLTARQLELGAEPEANQAPQHMGW